MKSNSVLIIKEHDIDGDYETEEQIYIDILHGFYNISWCKFGEQENQNHCNDYFAKYISRDNLNIMLTKLGFKRVDYKDINKYYNMSVIDRIYEPKKYIKNIMKQYWSVYIKY